MGRPAPWLALRAPKLPAAMLALSAFAGVTAFAADLKVSVRDLAARPLRDAVVFAESLSFAPAPAAEHPRAVIDQQNKEFVPLVSVIRTGTEIFFPNSDNIRHSIYSFSPAKTFNTRLYSGTRAPPILFEKPGLVLLGCNIHDTMVAWVVVVDTPYFAKTDGAGAATLSGLPPGDYRLKAWYPAADFAPSSSELHITGDKVQPVTVSLDAANSPLPAAEARAR
jgi:plastocyanin